LCEEKSEGLAMLSRVSTPLPANPRMENLFERAPFSGVLEEHGANPFTFQAPFARKILPVVTSINQTL
jgi:hypothetical protein